MRYCVGCMFLCRRLYQDDDYFASECALSDRGSLCVRYVQFLKF